MLDQETTGATSTPGSSLSATKSTLTALQERKQSLEELRETRMQEIQTLYDELYLLWNKLGVSDEEADEFVEMWQGTEQRCIDAVSLPIHTPPLADLGEAEVLSHIVRG